MCIEISSEIHKKIQRTQVVLGKLQPKLFMIIYSTIFHSIPPMYDELLLPRKIQSIRAAASAEASAAASAAACGKVCRKPPQRAGRMGAIGCNRVQSRAIAFILPRSKQVKLLGIPLRY